jgi:hypothetical protein
MKRQTITGILLLLPLVILVMPAGWRPHFRAPDHMEAVLDWLLTAVIGSVFTTFGLLKVYGWKKGIVGGGGKPASCRLLGRCPSWSKQVNIAFIVFFLGVGVVNLGICLVTLLKR